MESAAENISLLYEEYMKEYGEQCGEPGYTEVRIRWKDDNSTEAVIIKMSCSYDEAECERIFYYVNGIKELKELADKNNGQDFYIIGCIEFFNKL